MQSNGAPDGEHCGLPPAERYYHFKQVQQYSDNLTAHVMTCFNYPHKEPLAPAHHSFTQRRGTQWAAAMHTQRLNKAIGVE